MVYFQAAIFLGAIRRPFKSLPAFQHTPDVALVANKVVRGTYHRGSLGDLWVDWSQTHRLWMSALVHGSDLHLYYNMISLMWKGRQLERSRGVFGFAFLVAVMTLASSAIHVLLSVFLADVLEDPGYLTQGSIGFSGVLFALKVVANHEDDGERSSYNQFGFDVPRRMAVWTELLIIQVIAPNSSFLGHLSGILAGLLWVWSSLPFQLVLQPLRLLYRFPVTLASAAGLLALHLNEVAKPWASQPRFWSHPSAMVCLSVNHVWNKVNLVRLVSAPLEHASDVHFAFCLVSFLIKGKSLTTLKSLKRINCNVSSQGIRWRRGR